MVKQKNNYQRTFLAIIEFIKEVEGVKSDRAVAEILGLSTGDLGNRKKRGSIPFAQVIQWAISKNVSLDDVFTIRERAGAAGAAIQPPPDDPRPITAPEARLLSKTLEVLRASDVPGGYDVSLTNNIDSFHTAVRAFKWMKQTGIAPPNANPQGGEGGRGGGTRPARKKKAGGAK